MNKENIDKEVSEDINGNTETVNEDINENVNENLNESCNEDTSKVSEDEVQENQETDNSVEDEAFKIKKLEAKVAEQDDMIKRINAEYANYRRRTNEEKDSIGLYANEKIINNLIPVIDNMERAMAAVDNKEDNLYVGVEMVYKQMLEALKNAGLEEIPAEVGSDFDHNLHMAVVQESSEEFEAGKIMMVLQKGYTLGKKVLRATMVKVSS